LEKRLPLALFLAFLVLFAWTWLFPKPKALAPPPAAAGAVPESSAQGEAGAASVSAPGEPVAPALADTEERELVLLVGEQSPIGAEPRPGAYRARFTNRGAALLELTLADFMREVGLDAEQRKDIANWLPLVEPVGEGAQRTSSLVLRTSDSSQDLAPGGLDTALWQMEELTAPEVGVRFRYAPPGGAVHFEKTFRFETGTWRIHVDLAIENTGTGSGKSAEFVLVPAGIVPAELGDKFYSEPTAVAIGADAGGELEIASQHAPRTKAPGALEVPTPLVLAGVHSKYFAFLLREARADQGTLLDATYTPFSDTTPVATGGRPKPLIQIEVPLRLALPAPGEQRRWEYVVYAGPKDPDVFVGDFAPHELVLDDDLSVDWIARGLLRVLGFFHGLVGNWGAAIILLTLCVRLALFPLNRRSQTSMARYQKKMKRVQPKLEEAKKRYASDAQKLREAQARIMQEERAFPPLGGCAPIFLQMPVFFGLFSALRVSFDLRQAPFVGWIHDLSRPDHLLYLGLELPLLPDVQYLNVLPILMVVLWILQQMGMPKPADEQAARMQKMMLFMPMVFGVMLYNYAAGLSLYMMTTSTLSIIEQKLIRKLWPIDDREVEPKGEKRGCSPFAGGLQNMAERHKGQLQRVQAMQAEQRRQRDKRRR
jgi:YidC/Oxa1 family membrane protein insertase